MVHYKQNTIVRELTGVPNTNHNVQCLQDMFTWAFRLCASNQNPK